MSSRHVLRDFPLSRLERYLLCASWFPLRSCLKPAALMKAISPKFKPVNNAVPQVLPGTSVQLIAVPTEVSCWLTLGKHHHAGGCEKELSVWSPLGQALLGKTCGDLVQVQLFRRTLRFIVGDIITISQHR